ncbi:hypothetical protein JWS04_19990 [Bradyrhizobium vignae]|uniref:Secreted protein n=2 Tax=Bradyrhizobium vignae TaxID=1549949 RepID=A0ABS4A0X8_9BRAD|nr:hypothetical protein [Bradyrhizobium vignae]
MPADALLVTIVVVAIFVAFAAVLAWADRQTSTGRLISSPSAEAHRPRPARRRPMRKRARAFGSASTQYRLALLATLHRP